MFLYDQILLLSIFFDSNKYSLILLDIFILLYILKGIWIIESKNNLYLKYSSLDSSNLIKLSYNSSKHDLLDSVVFNVNNLNLHGILFAFNLFNL